MKNAEAFSAGQRKPILPLLPGLGETMIASVSTALSSLIFDAGVQRGCLAAKCHAQLVCPWAPESSTAYGDGR